MLPIAETFGLSGDDYLKASMMTVFAYGVMIGAYTLVFRYKRLAPLDSAAVRVKWLVVLGSGLALLAIVALFLYSAQFQMVSYPAATQYHIDNAFVDPFGIVKMMKYGGLVRGGHLDASLGFLQVIIMWGVPAMMMLSTAALMSKPVWRWVLFAAATIAWLTVLARVYHASGRKELTVILTMVPLAILLRVRSLKLAVLGGGALLIFGFLMVLAR
ncbi:MAG: hypothetical protein JKY92_02765 [Magnetovibrio sp.]|nr:hypothetical protein [Magnetovibrio sp.]